MSADNEKEKKKSDFGAQRIGRKCQAALLVLIMDKPHSYLLVIYILLY